MANRGVGNTAVGAASCRLIEQYQPEAVRLFTDPAVKELLGAPIRVLLGAGFMRSFTIKQADALTPGIYGAQVCRTRYLDDAVTDALSRGVGQLVILGAGLDTRAYRLPGVERARVFEVDLPAVQQEKTKRLGKHLGALPGNVTYVPIDFDTQSLDAVMAATSFDAAAPAVFLWEGVTQYLTEPAVRQTLAFVGKAAPGSTLLFTYVLKSIIERRSDIPGADRAMDRMQKNRAPWLFGLEPAGVAAYLAPHHLELVEDVGNAEYQERYLRPLHRDLTVSDVERTVRARVVAS